MTTIRPYRFSKTLTVFGTKCTGALWYRFRCSAGNRLTINQTVSKRFEIKFGE